MKNKKLIINLIVLAIIILGTFMITKSIYIKNVEEIDEGIAVGTTDEVAEYTGEIPNFSFALRGLYTGSFSDEELKESGIKIYQFVGSVKYTWGAVEHMYVGFKLKDLLDYKKIVNYDEIEFIDFNNLTVNYEKREITDTSYIILKRNGAQIYEQFAGFLDFNYYYNYSVEGLLTIVFK